MALNADQMERLLVLIGHTNQAQLQTASMALRDRSKQIQRIHAAKNTAALVAGETRVVTTGLRPKYLNGIPGTYMGPSKLRAGSLEIKLDYAPRSTKKRWSDVISVPASAITVNHDV